MEMDRYDIEEDEIGVDNQIFNPENRRFAEREADQPKRSPIRRKNKLQQEEGLKPKAKRNHKKIQHRLKYDWQGE
jgi:hypothetical protein